MLLFELTDALQKAKLPYALVGGYALALHGLVRATIDIDLVINLSLADFELAEEVLLSIGLQSRLPVRAKEVFAMRREYIENRNLIAWSFVDYKNPSRQVDVIITKDRKQLEVQKVAVSGRKISVVSLNVLLQMKTEAGRPQDLVDIENIKAHIKLKRG